MQRPERSRDAFFYGTLMLPQVIAKVVGHDTRDLHFSLARLQDHARHHIRGADYPALVSADVHHTLAGNNATKNPSVQGVLVSGLSEQDMKLLDAWEGDEYERVEVSVQLEDGSSRLAQAYLWRDSAERLAPEMWSFEAFMKEKAHHWTGGARQDELYSEVEALKAQLEEANRSELEEANGNETADPNAAGEFDFQAYLGSAYSIEQLKIDITPLSGGITNATCRAVLNVPEARLKTLNLPSSVILKHAPPFMYREGAGSPLSPYRQTVEARALSYLAGDFQPPHCPVMPQDLSDGSIVRLPKLLKHDEAASVLQMTDLGEGLTLSDWLIIAPAGNQVEDVARRLATFLIKLYSATAQPHPAAAAYFANAFNKDNNVQLFLTKMAGTFMKKWGIEDAAELAARLEHGEAVRDQDCVLSMNDLWSGSVLVGPDGACALVDWEYFGAADAASELGMLLSNVRSLCWRTSITQAGRDAAQQFVTTFVDVWLTSTSPMDAVNSRRFLLSYGREHIIASDFAKDDFEPDGTRSSVQAGAACLRAASASPAELCLDHLQAVDRQWVGRLLSH